VAIFGFEPRPKQLEALVWVIAERKDLILTAKTSFGKSLISQAVPLLPRVQVIIICILPLNVIGEEQVKKVARLPGAKPIHIQADNVDQNGLLISVCQGAYTHIYVSPELLVGPKYKSVLRNMTFRSHRCMLLHCPTLNFWMPSN
jgi:superfamily II DNA helicase RecQ